MRGGKRPGDDTTLRATVLVGEPGAGPQSGGLCLHVVLDKNVTTYPLPATGTVIIGRATDTDVRIEVPSISRRHAALHLGAELEVEDLGGANGVSIGSARLEPNRRTRIREGTILSLGPVIAVVQRSGSAPRPRRVWSHGNFEGRVEDECARAARQETTFAILRLRFGAGAKIEDVVSGALHAGDVLATYAPGELEVLLIDVSPEEASRVEAGVVSALAQSGVEARTGIVCYPRDGRTPDDLLAKAAACVRPAALDATGGRAIVGSALRQLEPLITRIARGSINVVLTGETGVGKELVAELVHSASPRRQRPFVRLNCAAFTETLLASELFGHERGAFTGADRTKPGLLETADGGTVFLDEVGEMPMGIQPQLLRVIEDKIVMRVGAVKGRPIDVRFVAATNRDLELEVAEGRFRRDLYFRLSGFQLRIPPLRERPDDIRELTLGFLGEAARSAEMAKAPRVSSEALELLLAYSWPGNVRELRNVIERAVLLCGGDVIGPEHLPTDKMLQRVTLFTPQEAPLERSRVVLDAALAQRDKQACLDALARSGGNQTRAARLLGISRNTLLARMDAFGIARPRKPRED
jgi:DNA-binding NtrC family response regulator